MTLSDDQRSRLRRAKLVGLVRDLTGAEPDGVVVDTPVITAAIAGDVGVVLTEDPGPAAVAGALVWAGRQGCARLVLLVDDLAGDTARWASYFDRDVEVRQVVGAGSQPASASPVPAAAPAPDDDPDLRGRLADAGLEVVVEDGVVRGEVLGLEVARLVVWPTELGGDGAVHLEAGVGRFDRDATAAMHQGETPEAALARAVGTVREHRRPGAGSHPLALLARERWVRAALVADPSPLGLVALEPVSTTVPAGSVRDRTPAAALGRDAAGAPVLVVCSVGADLSLVPVAADTRAALDPAARLVLALPERDRLPSLVALAEALREPAEVVGVEEPWS